MKRLTLKQARRNAGLTQEGLEAKSGIKQTTISAIESGRVKSPAFQTAAKLAEALGIDPRSLKFGAEASV